MIFEYRAYSYLDLLLKGETIGVRHAITTPTDAGNDSGVTTVLFLDAFLIIS